MVSGFHSPGSELLKQNQNIVRIIFSFDYPKEIRKLNNTPKKIQKNYKNLDWKSVLCMLA